MWNKLYFVFDVESVGLYGEGFAVGYVVVTDTGQEIVGGAAATEPLKAKGTIGDLVWVQQNIMPAIDDSLYRGTPMTLRSWFWEQMERWQSKDALIFADCACPVEARFLADCVADDPARSGSGPYPLHDVATVLLCAGMDPVGTYERLPSELPVHNPLKDARQSARMLLKALRKIEGNV